jgi:hypothetical protein
MIEQRLAGDRNQRLGQVIGQRAHAQAEAGGKDHGGGRRHGHRAVILE